MHKEIRLSNWLFHKGDIDVPKPVEKGPIYTQSKTERKLSGPAGIESIKGAGMLSVGINVTVTSVKPDIVLKSTAELDYNEIVKYFRQN